MELKGATDKNTRKVGAPRTPLTAVDRSSKQKVSREMSTRNDTLDPRGIILTGLFTLEQRTPVLVNFIGRLNGASG